MNTPTGPFALRRAERNIHHPKHHCGPHSNKTINMLTARGEARSSGDESPSPNRLAWVDPETGDPLELEFRCTEAFRDVLESIGFERVAKKDLELPLTEHTQ